MKASEFVSLEKDFIVTTNIDAIQQKEKESVVEEEMKEIESPKNFRFTTYIEDLMNLHEI